MTARQASEREPRAAPCSVITNGDERVLRTARVKAAGRRKERRDDELVEPNRADDQEPHAVYYTRPSAEVTSARRSA